MSDLDTVLREVADAVAADAREIEQAGDAKDPDATPGPVGIAVALTGGEVLAAGMSDQGFPIQSISKVFALSLALDELNDELFERVGREPSGDPFNSIVELERTDGIPRNPFINAGALVVSDAVLDRRGEDATVRFIREQSGEPGTPLDEEVLASETEGGDLNRSILSFLRHHGNLRGEVDEVLRSYVRQCALRLDCAGLARAGLYLADARRQAGDDERNRIARDRRRVLSLMTTCGHYDGSGDFAMRVGLPAKSGVGGGILAIVPGVASIAAWSPNLDQHGNSMQAFRALEMLCDRMDWSLFDG